MISIFLIFFLLYYSFTELDLRGIELDEKAVMAAISLVNNSSSLSILNMAGCEIQNVSAIHHI